MRALNVVSHALWLLVFAAVGTASVLDYGISSTPRLLHARQDEAFDDSSCYSKCELETCGGLSCPIQRGVFRRSSSVFDLNDFPTINESFAVTDHDLWKRVFRYTTTTGRVSGNRKPTLGQVSRYLPAVFRGEEIKQYGPPATCINDGTEQAVMHQREFGDEPFQIMTGGLHGCTMVTLVSKRAVWQAHFWEVYSMGHFNPDRPRHTAFQHRVLDAMSGSRTSSFVKVTNRHNVDKPFVAPAGPAINPDLFNHDDDETTLYIMTPKPLPDPKKPNEKPGDVARNPLRVKEMQEKVEQILGRKPRQIVNLYEALNYENPDDYDQVNQSHRGMCLFQYDPNSDGKGKKAWRLFNEANWATGKVA